jgi:phosphopantothenoylcysteine decarboxylase/phosphopantothenate--cysteine ligase
MRVLITAGPTREHWDRVRFLTSAATGTLGIELAKALVRRGHEAALVLGPTTVGSPRSPGVTVDRVVSAREMLAACERRWPECDAVVGTAAVADYRPSESHAGKRTKTDGPLTLELVRNPDVLSILAQGKGRRPAIGFALQVDDGEVHAQRKLVEKDLDAIVLDRPEAMGDVVADFRILRRDGTWTSCPSLDKPALAERLVDLLESLAPALD